MMGAIFGALAMCLLAEHLGETGSVINAICSEIAFQRVIEFVCGLIKRQMC